MANVVTNFVTPTAIDSAYAELDSGIRVDDAMVWAQLAWDNAYNSPITSYITASSTFVEGILSIGDYVAAYGSNLLAYPSTITHAEYSIY